MRTWPKICFTILLLSLILIESPTKNHLEAQDNRQITILGEYGGLTDMAWSPDGKTLAASTYIGTVLFDQDLNEVQALENPANVPIVNDLLWNSKGTELLAGNQTYLLNTPEETLTNNVVVIWDISTGKIAHRLNLAENVFAIPQVWDEAENKILLTATQVGEAQSYQLIIWDIRNDTTQEIDIVDLNIPVDAQWTWDTDEQKLETSRSNEHISLSGPNFETVEYTPSEQTGSRSTSPNGQYQAVSSQDVITVQADNTDLFELQDGDDNPFTRYTDINWSADSQTLVVWGDRIIPSLIAVEVQTGQILLKYTSDQVGFIASAKLNSDGTAIAIRTLRHELLIYHFETEKWSRKWLYGFSPGRSFSPDGTRIATAPYSQDLYIWDTAIGKELEIWKSPNPPSMHNYLTSIAWSPDGRYVATGSFHSVRNPHPDQIYPIDLFIWSAETHEVVQVVPIQEAHGDFINRLEWSDDSRILAYSRSSLNSARSHIGAYNVHSKEALFEYETHILDDIALHPSGEIIAFPRLDLENQIFVSLLDVATGNIISEKLLEKHYYETLVWHPGGQYLVGRDEGQSDVQVWVWQENNSLQDYMSFRLEDTIFNYTLIRLNSQGTLLAAGYVNPEDRTQVGLQIWSIDLDAQTASLSRILESEPPDYLVVSLGFSDIVWSPDGAYVSANTSDYTTSIWEVSPE